VHRYILYCIYTTYMRSAQIYTVLHTYNIHEECTDIYCTAYIQHT
jgi:hypothetical protein